MASGPFRGHVDIATRTEVKGWAHDPAAPERCLDVELVEGDVVLARTSANLLRRDLADAGLGTGHYGFAFRLGDHLFPFSRHRLRVRFADGGADVPGSPFVLVHPDRDAQADLADLAATLEQQVATLEDAGALNDLVHLLATTLDTALLRQWELGRPALTGPAAVAFGEPKSFAEAVVQVQHRFPPLDVPVEKRPVVSIVIVCRDRFADAYGAIESILAGRPRAAFEIIVVDDGSRDETLIARSVLPPAVRIHRLPTPVGRPMACKAGQALAQGQYVLFLDPRARLAPGCVDTLLSVFSDVPAAGLVGPRLLGPDGAVAAAGAALARDGSLSCIGAGLDAADPRARYRREVDAVPGPVLMIDRGVSVRVRGYDERFSATAYADADLAMRVRAGGRIVLVQPSATAVVPLDPVTLDPAPTPASRAALQQDRRRFEETWRDALAAAVFDPGRDVTARRASGQALVIDHAFPTPWADAGSAAVVSHIRALQELGYKVSFVPGGPADAHARATPALERFGVACYYKPAFQSVSDVLREIGPALDVVYIHRLSNARGYLDEVRRLAPKARVIFSVADLHHLREERQAALTDNATLLEAAREKRDIELAVASKVDVVITHSPVEAELLRAALPQARIDVVPWLIPSIPVKRPAAERSGLAFVGSYRHAPNLDAAQWLVDEVMPLVHARNPAIVCHLAGEGLPEGFLAQERPWLRILGWVPDLHEQVYERVRLTVAPLRFGAGVKGKVLESLAAGLPCVMTTIASEGIDLPDAARDWVRDDPAGFADAIVTLHDGAQSLEGVVAEAQAKVQLAWSESSVKDAIQKVVTLHCEAKMDTIALDPSVIPDETADAPAGEPPEMPRVSAAAAG